MIGQVHGAKPRVIFAARRPSDQRYYVIDTTRFSEATGWQAKVGVRQGVERLYRWLQESKIAGGTRGLKGKRYAQVAPVLVHTGGFGDVAR